MKITKTKNGFILMDGGLKIRFTRYEYSSIEDVYLYHGGVLVAIYENKKKFEEQLKKSC